jgi:hypothetical protein
VLLISAGHRAHAKRGISGMEPWRSASRPPPRARRRRRRVSAVTTVLGVETMTSSADDALSASFRHRPSHVVIVISSRVKAPPRALPDVPFDPSRSRARRRHAAAGADHSEAGIDIRASHSNWASRRCSSSTPRHQRRAGRTRARRDPTPGQDALKWWL